jgi:uncharacterized protein YcbK (DUF882 family)
MPVYPGALKSGFFANYRENDARLSSPGLFRYRKSHPEGFIVTTSPIVAEYRLRFYDTHTNERLDIVYRRGDVYSPEALNRLDFYLRDYRTGDVHHYDPHVFDLLHQLTASLGRPYAEINVICGYRTPRTNESLRSRSVHSGVAQHSLHMQAEAIDIRLPDVPTSQLRDAAIALHRGGVGYYRVSDFVHMDVGRVRYW